MRDIILDITRAAAFLGRLPMPARAFEGYDGSLQRTARAFPLAALVLSLPAAMLLLVLLIAGVAPLFSVSAALTVQVLITGALHEDGLADTADGFWGGRDKARSLEIMKDSRTGAYGVVAIVLSFVLRGSALAAIADESSAQTTATAFLLAECISRAAMLWHWRAAQSARDNGVAASAGVPDAAAARFAFASTAIFSALAWLACGVAGVPAALVLAALTAYLFNKLAIAKIGGHTGDTLGACQQVSAIAALTAFVLFV